MTTVTAIVNTENTNVFESAKATPEFKSKKLTMYTNRIMSYGANIKKCYAKISVALAAIDSTKCYQVDGFANVHDYAKQVLGLSKTVSYNLLAIGRDYIDSKTLESVLPHAEGNDFSTTQLRAILPIKSVDKAKELAESGAIHPAMSVHEIEAVIKAEKDKESGVEIIDAEPVENDETAETAETAETTETVSTVNVQYTIELAYNENGEPLIMYNGERMTVRRAKAMIGEFMSGALES